MSLGSGSTGTSGQGSGSYDKKDNLISSDVNVGTVSSTNTNIIKNKFKIIKNINDLNSDSFDSYGNMPLE
jgi:hypothetical protein